MITNKSKKILYITFMSYSYYLRWWPKSELFGSKKRGHIYILKKSIYLKKKAYILKKAFIFYKWK